MKEDISLEMNFDRRIINTSKMLLIFMTAIFCLTGVLFFAGISISYINIVIPFGVMLWGRYKFFEGNNKDFFCDVIISFVVLGIFILMASNVYDNTWDGSAYHKQAVGLLKDGWNPIYMLSDKFNNAALSVRYPKDGPLLWAEAYPKATWYFAASIYFITGNIEAGKCYTLIFAYITYGICLEFFKNKISGTCSKIVALFIALNPIVCVQFQSYYLDGVVSCILAMLIIKFIDIVDSNNEKISKLQYIEIFCLIVWGCNLKFSVVIFIVTFCAVFCLFMWIKYKKIDLKNTAVLFTDGIISVFVFGFAPYITNCIRHGNMFYGLVGMMKEENMQLEFGVDGLNRTGRFLCSLFGKMSHGEYKTLGTVLKIPFTFSTRELDFYSIVDLRVGGFGVFFSGLLITSILIIILEVLKRKREKDFSLSFIFVLSLIVLSLIEFCILPQTSQFRYIPHMYLCLIFAVYLLMKRWNDKMIYKVLGIICSLLMILNIMPWGYNAIKRLGEGINTTAVLKGMEDECEKSGIVYDVAFYCDDFTGMHYNLKDYKIKYVYTPIAEIGEDYQLTYSNWLYYKIIAQ